MTAYLHLEQGDEVLRNLVRNIHNFMTRDRIKEAENAYLNGAMDLVDLEYRQRQIDRGIFHAPRNFSHLS